MAYEVLNSSNFKDMCDYICSELSKKNLNRDDILFLYDKNLYNLVLDKYLFYNGVKIFKDSDTLVEIENVLDSIFLCKFELPYYIHLDIESYGFFDDNEQFYPIDFFISDFTVKNFGYMCFEHVDFEGYKKTFLHICLFYNSFCYRFNIKTYDTGNLFYYFSMILLNNLNSIIRSYISRSKDSCVYELNFSHLNKSSFGFIYNICRKDLEIVYFDDSCFKEKDCAPLLFKSPFDVYTDKFVDLKVKHINALNSFHNLNSNDFVINANICIETLFEDVYEKCRIIGFNGNNPNLFKKYFNEFDDKKDGSSYKSPALLDKIKISLFYILENIDTSSIFEIDIKSSVDFFGSCLYKCRNNIAHTVGKISEDELLESYHSYRKLYELTLKLLKIHEKTKDLFEKYSKVFEEN